MNGRFDLHIITQPNSEVYCGYFWIHQRFPTYRLVFMLNLPISHVWLGPVIHSKHFMQKLKKKNRIQSQADLTVYIHVRRYQIIQYIYIVCVDSKYMNKKMMACLIWCPYSCIYPQTFVTRRRIYIRSISLISRDGVNVTNACASIYINYLVFAMIKQYLSDSCMKWNDHNSISILGVMEMASYTDN